MPAAPIGGICVLAATIVISTVAFSVHSTSFLDAKEAAIGVGLLAMALAAVFSGGVPWAGFRRFLPLWVFLALAVAVHLYIQPSRAPHLTITTLARWGTLLLVGVVACSVLETEGRRAVVRGALVGSALLAATLALAQYFSFLPFFFPDIADYGQPMYSVFGNQGLLGGYLALALPFTLMLGGEKPRFVPWCYGAPFIIVLALALSGARSAWIAGAVGVLVGLLVARGTRRQFMHVAAPILLGVLVAYVIAPDTVTGRIGEGFGLAGESFGLRWWFWAGALRMIAAYPIAGVGPGNFGVWSPSMLGDALHDPGGEGYVFNEVHTVYAHNDALELLAEMGILGALCCLWMVIRLVRCRGPEWGGIAALVMFALLSPALRSAPHAIAGVVLAAMLLTRHASRAAKPRRLPGALMLIVALTLGVFQAWALWWPSFALTQAEGVHMAGGNPVPLYDSLAGHAWPNAQVRLDLAYALEDQGRYEEAEEELYQAHALGLDTGELWLKRAIIALARNDADSAEDYLTTCLYRWPALGDAWALYLAIVPTTGDGPDGTRWFTEEAWRAVAASAVQIRLDADGK
jgi:O-antigen ligase